MSNELENLFYQIEKLTYYIDEVVEDDREYFLERKDELVELLEQLKERIDSE